MKKFVPTKAILGMMLLGLLAIIAVPSLAAPGFAKPIDVEPLQDIRDAMHSKHNAIRESYKLDVPQRSNALDNCAQWYANYLAATGREGHFEYGTPWARAAMYGFTGDMRFNERLGEWYFTGREWKRTVIHNGGEVLAFHCSNIDEAFKGWLSSTVGHREAVLEPTFDSAGFGAAMTRSGKTIYVGMFGNSRACAGGGCASQAAQPVSHANHAAHPAARAVARAVTVPVRAVGKTVGRAGYRVTHPFNGRVRAGFRARRGC